MLLVIGRAIDASSLIFLSTLIYFFLFFLGCSRYCLLLFLFLTTTGRAFLLKKKIFRHLRETLVNLEILIMEGKVRLEDQPCVYAVVLRTFPTHRPSDSFLSMETGSTIYWILF